MLINNTIAIETENGIASTKGLQGLGYSEFEVPIAGNRFKSEVIDLLEYLANYVLENQVHIKSGETIPYGYWLLKLKDKGSGVLEVWEYNDEATEFIVGANLTLKYFSEQSGICKKYKSIFSPPRPDKKVAISDGVLEGDAVEGVRYHAPNHMSGWYITTDKYNGDFKTLEVINAYQLTSVRPDLAAFLALTQGFRFCKDKYSSSAWFDKEAYAQPGKSH